MKRFNAMAALAAAITLSFSVCLAAHAQSAVNAQIMRVDTSSMESAGTYNRFIVRYSDDAPTAPVAAVQSINAAMGGAGKLNATLSVGKPVVSYKRQLATGDYLVETSRKLTSEEAAVFMQSIASDPSVVYVAPDVLRKVVDLPVKIAAFTPNDSMFARSQTDFLPGDGTPTPVSGVANWGGNNITGAWDLADGKGITIAVIDTGIVKHADLNTAYGDAGYDFVSDAFASGRTTDGRAPGGWDQGDWTTGAPYSEGPNACVSPSEAKGSSWHGSNVAGIAGAAITNNALGTAGIAYNAKVIPVRALGHCGGHDSDIADALVWASGGHVDGVPDNPNPAHVINMSLGGEGACPVNGPYARAIAKARANGSIIVVAAGNEDVPASTTTPASCPGVITVGSVGVGSGRAYYSNYNAPGESVVKLAAFGGGIFVNEAASGTQLGDEGFAWGASNRSDAAPTPSPAGDAYAGEAGTSQATPHVAGVAALMQSARLAAGLPLLTSDQALAILQETAHMPHTTPDPAKTFGAGIVDGGAAVAAAAMPLPPPATVLTNGVALTGRSGTAGSETIYKIDVPANARTLVMRTASGTGDVSLYVKAGAAPTTTAYDYASVHVGNAESVTVVRVPAATTYYLRVVGVQPYSGVLVQATFTP